MTTISDTQLVEILLSIQKEVKEIKKEITDLKIELPEDIAELKVELAKLESNTSNLKENVQELKTTQKNQLWAVISFLGVAVLSTAIREFLTVPRL